MRLEEFRIVTEAGEHELFDEFSQRIALLRPAFCQEHGLLKPSGLTKTGAASRLLRNASNWHSSGHVMNSARMNCPVPAIAEWNATLLSITSSSCLRVR